jgi:hypothetical protein
MINPFYKLANNFQEFLQLINQNSSFKAFFQQQTSKTFTKEFVNKISGEILNGIYYEYRKNN